MHSAGRRTIFEVMATIIRGRHGYREKRVPGPDPPPPEPRVRRSDLWKWILLFLITILVLLAVSRPEFARFVLPERPEASEPGE